MDRPLRLVVATRNRGKTAEFARLLGADFRVEALPHDCPLPDESGGTFAENALIKARHAFQCLGGGQAVLADDSGLEVAVLQGRPGVLSARYAGELADDRANLTKLLADLAPHTDRSGRFVCVLALVMPTAVIEDELERVYLAEGVLEGTLEDTPRGGGGFGYDPVFRPHGWAHTLAELSPAEKDSVSHRGRAVGELLRVLGTEGILHDA